MCGPCTVRVDRPFVSLQPGTGADSVALATSGGCAGSASSIRTALKLTKPMGVLVRAAIAVAVGFAVDWTLAQLTGVAAAAAAGPQDDSLTG